MNRKIIAIITLLLFIPIHCMASYNSAVEKSIKKRYKEVTYMAHSDCYLVMSKSDKGYYGVCNSRGDDVIPANYKKISFEKGDNGETIIFALNPNFKAPSQGNIVYTLKDGSSNKVIDLGRNEPIYIAGGYVSSTGKPIYNLSGNIILNCQQTSVQPVRRGPEIIGYKVSTRTQFNNNAVDELLICGPTFNQLFKLDGAGYLWMVEPEITSSNEIQWKCKKNLGGTDTMTLLYSADGTPIDDVNPTIEVTSAQPQLLATNASHTQEKAETKTPVVNYNKSNIPVSSPQTQRKKISDIDTNQPVTTRVADKTFAVIISNENYSEVEKVQYALNDGESVCKYFEKTLGIPKNNIKYVPDATLNNMRKQLNWLKQIADAFGHEAKVIFYYSGHGVPDEQSKNAYLMPVDGYHSDMSTNLSINFLYEELANLNVSQVTIFMDACFSGSQRGDNMLVAARGVKIKSRANAPKGNLIVFSAAQSDETAYPLEEQCHGLFTYYLLKKLRDSGDKVTLGELSEYITSEVKKASLIQNGKLQTPSTAVSAEIEAEWQNRSL